MFIILFDVKNIILEKTEVLSDRIIFYATLYKRDRKCCACGSCNVLVKDSKTRTFRGCNLNNKRSYLKIIIFKFFCNDCHKNRWIKMPFAEGKLPYTKSYIQYLLGLVKISTILYVAQFCGIEWKTIKNIHKAELQRRPKQFSYKKLQYISVDEIAIKKGHHYMTVFTDISTGTIIFAVEGRKEQHLIGFLKRLAKRAKRLKAIAMDMSAGYAASVKKYLPNIDIVFDRFHVTKVLNKAVDEVRKEEWSRHKENGIKVGKGNRFLLLRNFEDLDVNEQTSLKKLLEINRNLTIVHTMKEQFRMFWEQETYQDGVIFLLHWCVVARVTKIKALEKAAKTILKHGRGLLNYFSHKITNGQAEGINNKIKVMKRNSYGCRDIPYFILKLYNLHKATSELVG